MQIRMNQTGTVCRPAGHKRTNGADIKICVFWRARKLEQAERRCEGFSAENFETQIEHDKLARYVRYLPVPYEYGLLTYRYRNTVTVGTTEPTYVTKTCRVNFFSVLQIRIHIIFWIGSGFNMR